MSQTVKLQVVGQNKMNCGGCERSVTSALTGLGGVEAVQADRTTQGIEVTLGEPGATIADLQAALQGIGYQTEQA